MDAFMQKLRTLPEFSAAGLLTVIFLTFLLQICSRYVFNYPISWTLEVCLTAWIWLVFWGAAFCVEDTDHVSFDILYNAVGLKWQKIFTAISALAIIVALGISLPATYDYIMFYRLKKSASLGIRLHYIFSIYGFFVVAIMIRNAIVIFRIIFAPDSFRPRHEII